MMSYNLSNVTKIRVIEKHVSTKWSWHAYELKKMFGLIKEVPYGFINFYNWPKKIYDKCPHNHYIKKDKYSDNMIVYENPQVVMWFNDGSNKTFYFKTAKEAQDAAVEVKKRSGCEWYEHS